MCMVDSHDIKSDFLEASAQHCCACTYFYNQRFHRWHCIMQDAFQGLSCRHMFRLSHFGCITLERIGMILLKASTKTTNVQSLAASATVHRQQIALPLRVPGAPCSSPCGILMVSEPCDLPLLLPLDCGLVYGPGLGAGVALLAEGAAEPDPPFGVGIGCKRCSTSG